MSGMTATERMLTALSHKEPDRVPFVLGLSLHGAKAVELPLPTYLASPRDVVEGQIRLHRRFGHDVLLGFCYAAAEIEAWGGEVVFSEDGPPRSGEPPLHGASDLDRLDLPLIEACPPLKRTLEVIQGLKAEVGDQVPILGVCLSPFALPVLQLGFGPYLDLMMEAPPRFRRLMRINQAFTRAWGQAQLAAGAMALICYDPLASTTMLPSDTYEELGLPVDRDTLADMGAPAILHLASGRALGSLDLLAQTGALAIGVSCEDDLAELKTRCRDRLALVGNLNGIAMTRWSADQATREVRRLMAQAGPGGGFVLGDQHGELPWQVPDEVIGAIAETVRTEGAYPLVVPNHG